MDSSRTGRDGPEEARADAVSLRAEGGFRGDLDPAVLVGGPAGTGTLAVVMYHYPFAGDTTQVSWYLLPWDIPASVSPIPVGTARDGPWPMGTNKDGTAISYTSACSNGPGTREYTVTLYEDGGPHHAIWRMTPGSHWWLDRPNNL